MGLSAKKAAVDMRRFVELLNNNNKRRKKLEINRAKFLTLLSEASIGLSKQEILEQSNCFVFTNDQIITFNDEIYSSVKSPLDFDAIVPAKDLLKIMAKIPDELLDISLDGGEIIIKASRRKAGLSVSSEIHLPFEAVPVPGKWSKLPPGCQDYMIQASQVCESDNSQYKTTCVHVTPDMIQACDNSRLFRAELKETGFQDEILIPAASIHQIKDLKLKEVSLGDGWVHFNTYSGQILSIRCSHESFHQGLDELLKIDGDELKLPGNLADMIDRAEVMNEDKTSEMNITIKDNLLILSSRKDGAWYKEKKKIKYTGPLLNFNVNPKFMVDVLKRNHKVTVDLHKMKLESEGIQFVVSLSIPTSEDLYGDVPF